MSPSDSCSETFSPTSSSLYTHSPGLPYDRMSDYRSHRVPPLQPPTNMSSSLQSQGTSVSGSASILGRTDGYPGTYTLHRGSFPPPLSSLGEMTRIPPYTATPRALESSIERTQNMYLGPGMLMDPIQQRLPQPVTDAPPFHETHLIHTIVAGTQSIKPEIQAKIHKGFFQVDEKWTCYRRNYFSVSCSFSLHPWAASQPLFVKFSDQATERVQSWSMSISAIVNAQVGEPRELVQHTPKRDKQSERKPGKVVLQPCHPPPLVLSHGASSNSSQHSFSLSSQSTGMSLEYSPYASPAQPTQPPTQHTFERIQFQKATANNGKRRAQQQYYNLVVELYAEIASPVGGGEPTQWIKIARRLSHPMVVRGRSPGHYKDGRRDSSTSMGPDGGSGGSGDGSGGTVLHPGLGSAARSHLALMPYDSSQRNGPHYGRTDYHQMTASDQSPLSESPQISSSSSSGFDIGLINDNTMDPMDSMKSTSSMDSYQDANFNVMNNRKPASHFRHQLPSFGYDPVSKPGEETSHAFPETYDSLMPLVKNDQHEPPHFLKHPPRLASHMYQHSSSSGYDPIYSVARTNDGTSYGRFPNSQSLCV
ncbi:PhoG like DNA-binding family protein [Aspergillus sclerotiicarbonarius CBS 121057]|uniref:PhoG like DNA-binding family protein n=1 Tax=Aspergillus sclerotiicarbonarius (strain CBS 121057 / IBT 28362) TaxID=1448318 RepID=A0A319EB80_ASPSB|nr:PhoG like DNA-binding family protein [Aspergillus sclerotiicarbonarius CBS 121057]